jgi:cytochrome c peroxidase
MGINRYILMISIGLYSCQQKDISPEPQNYSLSVPGNFPMPALMKDNPQTKQGEALGKLLFYDKRLSGNNQLSCASCHHQSLAFTDGLALSNKGASGKILPRTAPALINLAWVNNGLFWDGGSTNLESQAFGPLTNTDEMNQNLEVLVSELNQVPEYISRFKNVFNDDIKAAYIVRALAQFQRTIISGNSRYDKYVRKETGGIFSEKELQGLVLFNARCRSCHTGEFFTDNDYHNNGLDADFSNDALEGLYQGRFRISYNPADLGKFKTPTLRNIELTAPYMHDGRLPDLKSVLEHYSNEIKVSATTDTLLLGNTPLNTEEQSAIIAFLHTLTDSTFIHNKDLSEPVIP